MPLYGISNAMEWINVIQYIASSPLASLAIHFIDQSKVIWDIID